MTFNTIAAVVCIVLSVVSMVWGLPVSSKTEKPSSRDAFIYFILAHILLRLP